MERTEIKERLKAIIEPYSQDPEQLAALNEQTDLLRDLKINSAHLVDIILDTEDEFDIEIENDEAESMLTLDDVLAIIEKIPDDKDALLNLAYVNWQIFGDRAKAIDYLQKAVEADPGFKLAHNAMAYVYMETGEYQKALEALGEHAFQQERIRFHTARESLFEAPLKGVLKSCAETLIDGGLLPYIRIVRLFKKLMDEGADVARVGFIEKILALTKPQHIIGIKLHRVS